MKKTVGFGFGLVLLCGLLLVSVNLLPVSAYSKSLDLGGGTWSSGKEVAINLEKNPAPYNWYQLVGQGVKVSKTEKICHPFRGGQFKWVSDIRQLVDGKWEKITTTQGWLDGPESTYQICAQVTGKGIYALFAYYNGPQETIDTDPCTAGKTLIASSPTDISVDDLILTWDGSKWLTPEVYDMGSDMCFFMVVNNGSEPLPIIVRDGKNSCEPEIVEVGADYSAYIAGLYSTGTCPIRIYQ